MDTIVQVIVIVIVGYVFQLLMQVMGQKQLGSIIKICSWGIALFMIIGIVCGWIEWIDLRLQGIQDFFSKGVN